MEAKGTTGNLAKIVQKTLVRTKAKVLQNLGKADKTTDETFQKHLADFLRQQASAVKLNKEVKNYICCIRALTNATHSLYTVIRETYEPEWVDLHAVDAALNSLDMLVKNYEAELAESFAPDINSYADQFPHYKEKINKRGRKLLDYDDARHNYETARTAKKVDQIKVSKANELLQEADKHYNAINDELHAELPKFYDYRVDFLSSSFARLYSIESTFHTETGRLNDSLRQLMEKVPKSEGRQKLTSPVSNPHKALERETSGNHYSEVMEQENIPKVDSSKENPDMAKGKPSAEEDHTGERSPIEEEEEEVSSEPRKQEMEADFHFGYENLPKTPPADASPAEASQADASPAYPVGEMRLATHAYTAEDEDELTFEAGDVITVVEFDDPDDQDEGWLMGISKKSGKKGVFPENFTSAMTDPKT